MPIVEITSEHNYPLPTPVKLPTKGPGGPAMLRQQGGSQTLYAQPHGDELLVLLPQVRAGEKLRFSLEAAPRGTMPKGVTLKEGPAAVEIVLPEGLCTTYHTDVKEPRPYFWPVLGPGMKRVTRAYPMEDVQGEQHDHPHHRSFWTAYGEVNGVDDWSQQGNHGWIKHQKFLSRAEGPVFGGFEAASVWTHPDGKPLLDERRSIRVYNAGPERRLLDYEVVLIASHGEVHYGDTKEGGVMSWRVATTMDGARGGLMQNSTGGKTEKEVWGKRAEWLDYSGQVEGEIYGIGMMDHPGNLNHPCYWHARDYGLVGTNPFARAAFEKGQPADGYTQKAGETLRFRYRVLIHRGNAEQGRVEDAYHAWVQPPAARVVG